MARTASADLIPTMGLHLARLLTVVLLGAGCEAAIGANFDPVIRAHDAVQQCLAILAGVEVRMQVRVAPWMSARIALSLGHAGVIPSPLPRPLASAEWHAA